MCVWLGQAPVGQGIVTIVKLSDVSPEVFPYRKLTPGVNPFVAVGAQDEIVANYESVTPLDSLLNLRGCPTLRVFL